ncbi:MAG: HI0074 family nucleotidyltransferase substrate-binding subunit [Ignavibacteriaceae bacterium]
MLKEYLNKVVLQLSAALNNVADNDVYKAGCIQYFEFCFEISWKYLQQILLDEGIKCNSPKSCIRSAYKINLINNEEVWLDMLNDRNIMSHTYDAGDAMEIFGRLKIYQPEFQNLLTQIT